MKRPSEPSVPLSVFNGMFETLVALFEREALARREHEDRIVAVLADALKPAPMPEPMKGPLWVSEAEDDLRFGKAAGTLHADQIKELEAEIEFSRPTRELLED